MRRSSKCRLAEKICGKTKEKNACESPHADHSEPPCRSSRAVTKSHRSVPVRKTESLAAIAGAARSLRSHRNSRAEKTARYDGGIVAPVLATPKKSPCHLAASGSGPVYHETRSSMSTALQPDGGAQHAGFIIRWNLQKTKMGSISRRPCREVLACRTGNSFLALVRLPAIAKGFCRHQGPKRFQNGSDFQNVASKFQLLAGNGFFLRGTASRRSSSLPRAFCSFVPVPGNTWPLPGNALLAEGNSAMGTLLTCGVG